MKKTIRIPPLLCGNRLIIHKIRHIIFNHFNLSSNSLQEKLVLPMDTHGFFLVCKWVLSTRDFVGNVVKSERREKAEVRHVTYEG